MPARGLPADQVAEARGFADSFALRLPPPQCRAPCEQRRRATRWRAPCSTPSSRRRVEALGARGYAGVAANLATALDLKLRADPITRARGRDEVPLSHRARADGARAADRCGGARRRTAPGLALVRDWIEEKAGADLDRAGAGDRRPARLCPASLSRLLEDLQLVEGEAMIPDEADRSGRIRGRGTTSSRPTKARTATRPKASRARARSRRAARARDAESQDGEEGRDRRRRIPGHGRRARAMTARRAWSRSGPTGLRPIWRRISNISPRPPALTR